MAGGEEDGGDDDEEILGDEVDYVVGVLFGGEGAGDVADDFEDGSDGERGEVPGSVKDELVGRCGLGCWW